MLLVGFHTSLHDFLDDVCHLFNYDEDGPELGTYIYLWELTGNPNFCQTLAKFINIDMLYRTGEDEHEKIRNDELFALEPEMRRYSRDSVLDYDICLTDFDNFAYVFRHYISGWITEFNDYGKIVKDLRHRGDRLDVIIS